MRILFIAILFNFICLISANAAIEVYEFENESQEQQFKTLSNQLRCPMCLNSNLAGSDAPIAADLRAEIYSQITEGRSNQEIIDFMTQRYGNFINYRPPLNSGTFVLWFGPLFLLLLGLAIVWRMAKANKSADINNSSIKLTSEQKQEIKNLLSGKS